MNPFNFNHFIAYFIPGVIFWNSILVAGSVAVNRNLLKSELFTSHIFITLIFGTIFGILIDELKHTFLGDWLEGTFLKGYKEAELNEIESGLVRMHEHYLTIRDEIYYFFAFDINIGIVSIFLGFIELFCLRSYLQNFYSVILPFSVYFVVIPTMLFGFIFFVCGINAHQDYWDSLKKALDGKSKK